MNLPEVGKRITVLGSHPHAGKTGNVISHEKTLVGEGAIVEFDDEMRAFIFPNDRWQEVVLPKPKRRRRTHRDIFIRTEYDL